jgi:hypothetical protein
MASIVDEHAPIATNGEHETKNSEPIDVNALFSFIQFRCNDSRSNDLLRDSTTHTSYNSVSSQPANYAVQQFLARYPQNSSAAVDDLLCLIKYLTSPDVLLHTRQMPITLKTLSKETYESIQSNITHEAANVLSNRALSHQELCTRYCINSNGYSKVTGLRTVSVSITGEYSITLPYFDIITVALDIVANHSAIQHHGKAVLQFASTTSYQERETGDGSLLYSEVTSGQWFKEVEQNVSPSKVLAIIPYVDGVNVDFFDSISMIPLVITLGNLERKYRNQLSGKRLVAFIPNPTDEEIRLHVGQKEDLSHCRHLIWNKCLEM